MLGLPLGRRLAAPEIHQAFKRAAKSVHPDGGGNENEFLETECHEDAGANVGEAGGRVDDGVAIENDEGCGRPDPVEQHRQCHAASRGRSR